ncbi:hypothetical protein B0T25DRAFT_83082 [Lasiosphaeria hispida]|uniref:PH domain-containing protein n=1 Tax=Lasiosphaeria hispida TaxID=260671 RepID=A0AAJ0MHC7_9PEZI|nr:hypothetical protein B0T25DRAFT_83082 [Lasiosphaeria hispida]
MEGLLTVPPDRGTIIGRAIWKPRYVVVGSAQRDSQIQQASNSRIQTSRGSTPKGQVRTAQEGIYLSIYKSKDDSEPIQQHAIATVTDCQVQMLAHRKQGPVLPTLVINIVPDPVTDKLRKRRSSRTAGLTATKETAPTTLYFRPGDEGHALLDWARLIQQLIPPNLPDRAPLSPTTPASPTFINPFAPRPREPSDMHRPGSGNSRPPFYSKSSNQGHSSRERDRPVTYSETHSLRSKPSDLSSHTSSMNPSHMGFHNYTTMHPTDLPSPATTIGDYHGEFIEGWTSAQGRSSTLSSPIRTRDSIGSQIPPLQQPMDSSSPPGPRETILDRAFQLRYIPGSERETPGEEKLSSLARFDALMREADEKRRNREAEEARLKGQAATPATTPLTAEHSGLKSAWDMDDSDSDDEPDYEEGGNDSDGPVGELNQNLENRFPTPPTPQIPPPAQRALEFIAGRHEPPAHRPQQPSRSNGARSPLSYNHEALMVLSNSGSSHLQPQTGCSKNQSRPGIAQRTHSQPQLAGVKTSSSTPPQLSTPVPQPPTCRDVPAPPANKPSSEDAALGSGTASAAARSTADKRLSASSSKRLSFTEFTKRLSSTSSLLLVPSGGSSRGSNSDVDSQQTTQNQQQYSHHLHPRAPLQVPQPANQQQPPAPLSERCGWRGSVGVFGADGGFL